VGGVLALLWGSLLLWPTFAGGYKPEYLAVAVVFLIAGVGLICKALIDY